MAQDIIDHARDGDIILLHDPYATSVEAALRAIDAAILARHLRRVHRNRVSFDMVVETMNKTGIKLPIELKESALGGLASVVKLD